MDSLYQNVNVRCLVLDKRIEQWKKLNESLLAIGIECKPFIAGSGTELKVDLVDTNEYPPIYPSTTTYPTWRNRPNAFNAWKAHRAIFQSHLESDKEYLLLLEDDAVIFNDDFSTLINSNSFCQWIISSKLDMFYFGWYSNGHLHDINREKMCIGDLEIKRFIGGAGFHGVLIRSSLVKYLASLPPIGPYDWIAGFLQEAGLITAYAVYPSVIMQASGHSYVEGHHLDKPDRMHA